MVFLKSSQLVPLNFHHDGGGGGAGNFSSLRIVTTVKWALVSSGWSCHQATAPRLADSNVSSNLSPYFVGRSTSIQEFNVLNFIQKRSNMYGFLISSCWILNGVMDTDIFPNKNIQTSHQHEELTHTCLATCLLTDVIDDQGMIG